MTEAIRSVLAVTESNANIQMRYESRNPKLYCKVAP